MTLLTTPRNPVTRAPTPTPGWSPDLVRIAAIGLPGAEAGWTASWTPALGAAIAAERLAGLAMAGLESGVLDVPADMRRELEEQRLAALAWVLRLNAALRDVADAFEGVGARFAVLKGPAIATTAYPSPAWRPYRDLDVLVDAPDWRPACGALEELGFVRRLPEPRPGFDERFGRAAEFARGDRVQVDLHRRLSLGPFGFRVPTREVLLRTVPFEVAGRKLLRPDDTVLLIHACMHAALGSPLPEPIPLRDVAQLAASPGLAWDEFDRLVTAWGVGPVAFSAFTAVTRTFGDVLPERAARYTRRVPSPAEARLLEAYRDQRRGRLALAAVGAIPGLRSKVRYVVDLALPSRGFLSARAARPGILGYLARWTAFSRPVGRRD